MFNGEPEVYIVFIIRIAIIFKRNICYLLFKISYVAFRLIVYKTLEPTGIVLLCSEHKLASQLEDTFAGIDYGNIVD